jgi:hypothetical protein
MKLASTWETVKFLVVVVAYSFFWIGLGGGSPPKRYFALIPMLLGIVAATLSGSLLKRLVMQKRHKVESLVLSGNLFLFAVFLTFAGLGYYHHGLKAAIIVLFYLGGVYFLWHAYNGQPSQISRNAN